MALISDTPAHSAHLTLAFDESKSLHMKTFGREKVYSPFKRKAVTTFGLYNHALT